MSFSTDVKEELSKLNNLANKDLVKAELYGYLDTNNVVKDKQSIKFSTESKYNINRFSKLLNNLNINKYDIILFVNGCGQCPQFVHSREIFIIKMILIIQIIYELPSHKNLEISIIL